MKSFLEVDSIVKYVNGKKLLSDVCLTCELGDVIGVFGRNGSGKSTLLKIIFGIETSDSKFIRVNNEVNDFPYLIKNGISFLSQDNFIPASFSVKKVIRLLVEKNSYYEFIEDELISRNLNNRIVQLSGGELRYLQIKLLLFNNSKFCLLDEPYAGVSPLIVEKINRLIIEKSKSKGIIITDHNYRDLLKICNKIMLLKEGKLIKLNDEEELVSHGYLSGQF